MGASCGAPPRRTCENRRVVVCAQRAASKRWLTVEAVMPTRLDPPDMPRLDVLDEEFGEDAAAVLRARRRRTGARLSMLAIVALGLGAIGAFAFAWSNADGRLRLELQSAATAPKSAQRAAAQEEIERLQGELDALKSDVKELTEAQHQAAHTIATKKAGEEDLRRDVPPRIGTRTRRRWTGPSQTNRNGPASRRRPAARRPRAPNCAVCASARALRQPASPASPR